MSILTSRRPARQAIRALDAAADLEREIDRALDRMIAAPDRCSRLTAWHELRALVQSRSARRVVQMERERGLVPHVNRPAEQSGSH